MPISSTSTDAAVLAAVQDNANYRASDSLAMALEYRSAMIALKYRRPQSLSHTSGSVQWTPADDKELAAVSAFIEGKSGTGSQFFRGVPR